MTPEAGAGLLSLLSIAKDLTAFSVLAAVFWLLLDGRIVTRGHLNDVVQAERQQTADARAEREEWKLEAKRLANEIVPPLLDSIKEQTRAQIRELRELQGPR